MLHVTQKSIPRLSPDVVQQDGPQFLAELGRAIGLAITLGTPEEGEFIEDIFDVLTAFLRHAEKILSWKDSRLRLAWTDKDVVIGMERYIRVLKAIQEADPERGLESPPFLTAYADKVVHRYYRQGAMPDEVRDVLHAFAEYASAPVLPPTPPPKTEDDLMRARSTSPLPPLPTLDMKEVTEADD